MNRTKIVTSPLLSPYNFLAPLFFFVLMLALLPLQPLSALDVEIEGMSIDTGILFIANEVYDTDQKDIGNPVVSYTLGATLPIYFTKNFFLSPSMLFFTSIYAPSDLTKLALPADSAEADTLTTLGMWIDVSAGYRFIFNRWQLGAQGGLAFLFRIPMWGPASDEQRAEIGEGLYKNGRFIYISTGVWASILITDQFDLVIRYKTEIPIFNIWCDSGLTFFDQWGMSLTIGIGLHF